MSSSFFFFLIIISPHYVIIFVLPQQQAVDSLDLGKEYAVAVSGMQAGSVLVL